MPLLRESLPRHCFAGQFLAIAFRPIAAPMRVHVWPSKQCPSPSQRFYATAVPVVVQPCQYPASLSFAHASPFFAKLSRHCRVTVA